MNTKLYNNTIELDFDPVKHKYKVGGKPVDGTTGALSVISKPALLYWALNQAALFMSNALKPGESYDEVQIKAIIDGAKTAHRKISSDAAGIGSLVHQWIADYISGKKPKTPINSQIKNATDQFLNWIRDYNVKFIESEKVLYSKKYNYAGTLDFIAEVNGEIAIGDFKTSSGIWDEYWLQVAAYQQAYQEEYPESKIKGALIVRLGKDGTLEIKRSDEYAENVKAFNGALALYRRLQELKK